MCYFQIFTTTKNLKTKKQQSEQYVDTIDPLEVSNTVLSMKNHCLNINPNYFVIHYDYRMNKHDVVEFRYRLIVRNIEYYVHLTRI